MSADGSGRVAEHMRAQRAFQLAKQALATRDGSHDEDALALAIQLFRQSIYWSLLGTGAPGDREPAQLFVQRADELRAGIGPDADELLAVLTTFDFTAISERSPSWLLTTAKTFERAASQLLVNRQRGLSASQRRQTWPVAAAFVAMGVVLVALTGVAMGMLSTPNLAQGKPYTQSSVYPDCDFEAKRCGGTPTAVFFCTNEEDNPWFEYDLGKPTQFSSLTILNRSDSVQERAVPLVVEISNDRKTYKEIAKRVEVFDAWNPSFSPPQRARYVRLRVTRRSFLHLDAVEVHP